VRDADAKADFVPGAAPFHCELGDRITHFDRHSHGT
jgi:hypothetical protein